ncbi:hypothetical protein [Actinophytocola sp.]|uniref:hypothetical protein n=1 Tax=Actinophytocola sp. TaxID=1872138 RepID=UPI003D6BF290
MPEPILVAIAAALASRSAGSLYELVKRKFSEKRESIAALAAADGKPADSPEVAALSAELAAAEQADPDFSTSLRALWQQTITTQQVERGGVANQISGDVQGNVVQARDIGRVDFT